MVKKMDMFRLLRRQCIILSLPFLMVFCAQMERGVKPEGSMGDSPILSPRRNATSTAYYHFILAQLKRHEGDLDGPIAELMKAVTNDPESPLLRVELARFYIKKEMVNEAIAECRKALSMDGKFVPAHVVLGGLYTSLKKTSLAVEHYRKVLEIDPENQQTYLYLASLYRENQQYDEAIETLKKLIHNFPDQVMGLYYLGRIYAEMKRFEESISYYEKLLSIKPDFTSGLIDLGTIYEIQKKPEKAIEIYQEVLKIDPEDKTARERLGQLYIQKNQWEDALSQYREIRKFDAEDLDIRVKMGLIYFEQGKYDDAILEFSFVLTSKPKDDKVRFYLGTSYLKKKNYDQAITEYMKIPEESTLYVSSRENAAIILEDLERVDEAIDLLEGTIEIKSKETSLYLLLSSFYERREQSEKALQVLLMAHQFDEKNVDLLFQMGVVSDKLGKFEDMVRLMRQVIGLNPEHADALNYLGYTFADKGINLDESLELIQKALKLKPGSGYITDSLGWLYYKKGEYEKAVIELEKAIELTPDDPIITEHLGDGYVKVNLVEKALELYERALQLKPKEDQLNRLRKKIEDIKAKKDKTP